MGETLIKVEGLSKKFCRDLKKSMWYGMKDIGSELLGRRHGTDGILRHDEFWAVKDINFELKRGECLGLIGHNGAGKTTLLRMLNGLIRPDQGRIEMRGKVGALIALGAGFNPILTGRENVYVNAAVLGLSKLEIEEKMEEILDFAEIGEFIDSPVQNYSSGMQVRLGFAVATALEPDIIILDEVLAVGDASFRAKCFNLMHAILNKSAVIFVSHNMQQISRICNHAILLKDGKISCQSDNVSHVISKYHESVSISEKQTISGTGATKIVSVSVINLTDENASKIYQHQAMRITINFRVLNEVEFPLKILITVQDESKYNVAQILEDVVAPLNNENTCMALDIENAPFNSGKFSLIASILSGPRGELTSVVYNAAVFIVSAKHVSYAPIVLSPKVLNLSNIK